MKFAIVLAFALLAVAAARPNADTDAQVLRLESDVQPESFSYAVETSNGISAQQQGQLNNAGSENEAIAVKGSFSFVDTEGKTHTITYIADENGYQPQGEDIPVAPVA